MIAGLPWTTWLLLAAAVAPGLGLAIAFHGAHRADRFPPDEDSGPQPSGSGASGGAPGTGGPGAGEPGDR